MVAATIRRDRTRGTTPRTTDALRDWIALHLGVAVPHRRVCPGHHAPASALYAQYHGPLRDPLGHPVATALPIVVVLGSRGAGKSYDAAILTHLASRFNPGFGTRILGGSKAQSEQVYRGLEAIVRDSRESDTVRSLLKESATYRNGSQVSILAASPTSVRGPHVPALRLDEVDEIDPDIREAALGMAMEDRRRGYKTQVAMTSTWHRITGPMSGLIERARAGDFPLFTYCAFEVLERCPPTRSGPWVGGEAGYENCPACPIKPWCHEGRADRPEGDPRGPKAKRSAGHYTIDSLIQKVRSVSPRVFEADYLCRGPKADGLWFPQFDLVRHVTADAEYDPALPVWLAVDSGVFTGAVLFQVRADPGGAHRVTVFADYLAENRPAESAARELLELARTYCNGRLDRRVTDPAGGARNPVGPTVLAEYARAGLTLDRWPVRPVADGLALVDSFLLSADGTIGLTIHPRCKHLTDAFRSYRRAKRQGQWQDAPADPAHPEEDLIDALRGGLVARFPDGRRPDPKFVRMPVRRLFS